MITGRDLTPEEREKMRKSALLYVWPWSAVGAGEFVLAWFERRTAGSLVPLNIALGLGFLAVAMLQVWRARRLRA